MNDFIATHIPSLLLLGAGDILRIAGVFFVVVFCVVFFFMVRKYRVFEGSSKESLTEEGNGRQQWFRLKMTMVVGLFCCIVFGSAFFVERWQSVLTARALSNDGYVLVGEATTELDGSGGEVLGDSSVATPNTSLPKSENFRLGSLMVGGDNRMYLANTEDKKLAVSGIGYKTVIDENRENTGAIIKWRTNKPSRGEILYRKSADTEFRSMKEDSYGWEHTLVLEKLGYASTYIFLIDAKDKWGNESKSENYALYSGSNSPSLFDLLANAFGDMFGWAM